MDDLLIALSISRASGAKSKALYDRSAEIEYVNRIFRKHPGLAPYWEQTRDYIQIIAPELATEVDTQMSQTKYPLITDSEETRRERPSAA